MADSQDKLTPADAKKLAELEQQINRDKKADASAKKPTANQPSASATSSTATKSSASSTATNTRNAKPQSYGTGTLWLVSIFNLLVLAAIAAGGYWAWTQWQNQSQQQTQVLTDQKTNIQQQQAEFSQALAASQTSEAQLVQQNQALQSSVQSLIEQLQITSQQVATNQQNLADVSGRRPSDWLLAEADYLVRMAGRKLWLENDVKTAVLMLESADSRIQDLDDPSLLPIREKLADDIQALLQVNPISIDSVALETGALIKQVDSLPLAFFKKPATEQIDNPAAEVNDWRSNLARNWQQVTENFFSVKRKTVEIKPFMSDQEQWLSKQQLIFALLQAQTAVLKENQALFQQSLATANTITRNNFDTKHLLVTQFMQGIESLKNTDINRVYPEQFSAAPLLQDTIDIRLDNRFKTSSAEPTNMAPAEQIAPTEHSVPAEQVAPAPQSQEEAIAP